MPPDQPGLLAKAWQRGLRDTRVVMAGSVLALVILVSILCPLLAPQNPYDLTQLDIMDSMLPPLSRGAAGQLYLLGTDDQGRDILSGIMYGLQISILVGIVSGVVALLIGTTVGLTAAYFGGIVDAALMRLVDLQLSFPAILIALILVAVLGTGVDKIIIALIVVQWAYYARASRSAAPVERNKEYVEAAHCLRFGTFTILRREILPNALPPMIVVGSAEVAAAIRLEATLSFLGLGLPVTQPSLGLMIANGYQYMISGNYWISIYPGIALLLTVASLNTLGDHLRDVLNPRSGD